MTETTHTLTAEKFAPAGPSAVNPALAGVLSAYLGSNPVAVDDIPKVADTIKRALGLPVEEVSVGEVAEVDAVVKKTPREIKASIKADGLLCFEDGKTYKTMKRALAKYDLTPEQYRAKWGLPADYPMTAPSYAAQRRDIAIAKGFGRRAA